MAGDQKLEQSEIDALLKMFDSGGAEEFIKKPDSKSDPTRCFICVHCLKHTEIKDGLKKVPGTNGLEDSFIPFKGIDPNIEPVRIISGWKTNLPNTRCTNPSGHHFVRIKDLKVWHQCHQYLSPPSKTHIYKPIYIWRPAV